MPPALMAVANHQQTNNFSNGWLLFIATHYALRSKLRTEYNRGVPRGASAPRLQVHLPPSAPGTHSTRESRPAPLTLSSRARLLWTISPTNAGETHNFS